MSTEVLSRSTPYFKLAPQTGIAPRPARRFFGLKVLVVDDDAADVSLILSVLNRHPNVSTACATDSPAFALRQLAGGRLSPDLILLDIHMPRIDGFEFLEAFHKMPGMANVPVVFLTTSRLRQDVVDARGSSASLYVVKPDSLDELQAHLNGVVRRAAYGAWNN